MESVTGVIVGQVLVVRMLCDVVLVRKEGPDAAKLEDAFAAVKDGQLIDRSQITATLSRGKLILFKIWHLAT